MENREWTPAVTSPHANLPPISRAFHACRSLWCCDREQQSDVRQGRQSCHVNHERLLWSRALADVARAHNRGPRFTVRRRSVTPLGGRMWVTAPDLASGGDSRSVLEALQHARPSFLNAHGPPLAVVLDDSFVTDISMLSTLSAADVCEIRLQRPPNAVATIRDGSDLPAEWSRVRLQLEWRRLIEAGGYAVPKTHPCFPDLVRAGLRQGG